MVLRFEKSCVLAFFAFTVTTAVVIVHEGGYQNILVTFSPDITKDDQSKVLSETKDLLKLASNSVYKATGIYFQEVVFLLPYTWGNVDNIPDAGSISLSTANEVYDDANIFIENISDSVYGTYPYTLQRGGCGTQGVRIIIPKDFLNPDKAVEVEKARFIAGEWIRYRYGVFYENGYPNDDRYPLYFGSPGSNDPTDIQVTGCTDKPVNYTLKNSEGQECSLSVDVSGRPDGLSAACKFRPQESENDSDVSSSLMFLQDLPTITELCDDQDHAHNADALNKQNSLCNGRSIWNVMSNHLDFENRELRGGTDVSPDPEFKITVDGNPRIVLAVDRSASVKKTTGDIVVTAMEKFILDLPNETEFSLFLFNSIVEKILISRSRPSLNFVFKGETSCPSCAIRKGLQVLTNGNSGKKGTIVIMSSTDSVNDTVNLSNQLNSQKICLFVILYGSSNSGEGFRELLNASPCSHLWIMPPTEEKTKLHVLTQLNEKLESVIKNHSYHNAMYTVKTVSITPKKSVSFTTDRSIQDFQIRLVNIPKIPERAFEDDDVKLTNSQGVVSLQRIQNFEQYRTYEVTSVSNTWNFNIEYINPDELNEPFLLQVVAKESNSKSLRVHLWVEDTTTKEASENSEQLPVILYVEVTMGINPVLYAKVLAVIDTPDQNKSEIDLLDNGFGDPDVTKGDGIYSRYFTQFTSKGDYRVTVTISDNGGHSRTALPPDSGPSIPCCGSFIPTGAKESTGPFERVIKTNFKASSGRPSDGYKPSRVQDLRLLSWDESNLSLQWSSPGNEMDTGAAKEYMFGLFETKQEAETNFENPISGAFAIAESIIPQSFSSKETIKVQLSENLTTDRNYCFAMRSQSKEGRQSDTSNVVQIFIPSAMTSRPPPPPTDEAIETGDGKSKTSSGDAKIIGIVVGVCVLLIIIFIAAYIAFYLIIIRPKRKKNEDEGPPKTPRKTSRGTNEDLGDGTEPANEWQMENNGISPVNSWPSNVLVNHHQKVKEAKRKNEMPPVFTLEQLETSADKINTVSNGLLPNPIYSSCADDLRDHEKDTSAPPLQDYDSIRPSKRVTHV